MDNFRVITEGIEQETFTEQSAKHPEQSMRGISEVENDQSGSCEMNINTKTHRQPKHDEVDDFIVVDEDSSTKLPQPNIIDQGNKELPQFLKNKRAIINVKNQDNRCFGYALLSALCPAPYNPGEVYWYKNKFTEYHLDQIQYPVTVDKIPQIEDQLQINICIFSYFDDEGKGRYPIYVSQKNYSNTIDLLYWNEHYAWIKNFSAFMNDKNSHSHKRLWCKRCLAHFKRKQAFETHQLFCKGSDLCDQIYTMPVEGSKLSFKHFRYKHILLNYVLRN